VFYKDILVNVKNNSFAMLFPLFRKSNQWTVSTSKVKIERTCVHVARFSAVEMPALLLSKVKIFFSNLIDEVLE
jgi:hypothetical protein